MRWGFIGIAIGSLTVYLVVVGSTFIKMLKERMEEMDEPSEDETPE
jgi:hypothetical protein